MIDFLKAWCEGIVVAVMICVIIEAILPEGNHKKYVKVVIGIYLVFTILNPFLGKLDTKLEWKNDFELASVETMTVDTKNIQEVYMSGIKESLRKEIEEKFACKVSEVVIEYDETYENMEKISLKIEEMGVACVERVEIGNTKKTQESKPEYAQIQNYISENYEVDKSKIWIN